MKNYLPIGARNIYTCDKCHGHVVTQDADQGTTPFMMPCKATPDCGGRMTSSMYRVFDQSMAATFEWYKPADLKGLSVWEIDHVKNGGTLLRPATAYLPPPVTQSNRRSLS